MDTQELFKHAKEDLLAKGSHAPILYVEYVDNHGKEAMYLYYFAEFGGTSFLEESKQFFVLGAQFGQENKNVDFTCLTFISEAWVSTIKTREKPKFKRPSEDSNKKEYLIAQITELMPISSGKKQMKQSMLRAEIIHPTPDTVDLIPYPQEGQIGRLLFPSYFLAGYSSTQLSDEELADIVKKLVR